MVSSSSAARTNLSSRHVTLHRNVKLGEGAFRIAYAGTYIGGNRNSQEAVCKCFKSYYQSMETEFFQTDYQVADRAIEYAEGWNAMCEVGKEILMTRGDIMKIGGTKYLVEPLIRYFTKFTSNNGWIASQEEEGWAVLAMEAFSHYTYHRSGGQLIVCDLQGRHRSKRSGNGKRRFELTDPAICSRQRSYGPTDLGEKGIESFFANHSCNRFCHAGGENWVSSETRKHWFVTSSCTSMLRSTATNTLATINSARFNAQLEPVYDDGSDEDSC
jgi:hypothetical protein